MPRIVHVSPCAQTIAQSEFHCYQKWLNHCPSAHGHNRQHIRIRSPYSTVQIDSPCLSINSAHVLKTSIMQPHNLCLPQWVPPTT
eukprot:5120284-Pleurochrysis_carterae.AAC.1